MLFFSITTAKRVLVLFVLIGTLARVSCTESISPRRLVEVTDFGVPIVSPDGSRVAFRVERASIERNTYDSEWYVQDIDDTLPPRLVADDGVPLRDLTGNSTPGSAVWSPDGRWIYYRALLDGKVDVWRAAADGSRAEPLTHDLANVRDFTLSEDGRILKYSVGARRDEEMSAEQREHDGGIRIDETVPIGQGVFRSGYVDGRLATERFTGRWFELRSLMGNAPDHWKAVDLVTGVKRYIASVDAPSIQPFAADVSGMSKPWKFMVDPRSGRIALLTRVGGDHGLPQQLDVELAMLPSKRSRRLVRCQDKACVKKSITGIQWRPGTDEVLFTVTDPSEGYTQSTFQWNVESGIVVRVTSERGSLGSCSAAPNALVCVTADAAQPPRLERIDLDTGKRSVLFDPNMALAMDLAKRTPVRLLRWQDAKGREFTGQYFPARSIGAARPPLFISYYSCEGFVRGGVGDEFPFATFAGDGISALCINRLPGFTLDAVERHDEGRAAVESVVDLLASKGEIDRGRVGMGGLSFGGAVALWTATESNLLTAVSVSSPVVTPNYYLFNSLRGTGFSDELKKSWGLGAPDATPERWRALSPAFKLDRISAPILFQNSEQEYLGELEYALPLIRTHRADLYVFPNEPHLKVQPRHKLAVYERNLDWFRFWLQGVLDLDPAKAKQYQRWERMRAGISVGPHVH